MNPFAGWSKEDVERHNSKLSKVEAPAAVESPKVVLEVRPSTDESGLNKLERSWLFMLRARQYRWIGIQNITLKLADDCRYTPDFSTVGPNGEMIFWETKGFMRGDAQVKLKAAARMFPWAVFYLVEKEKGQFIETKIKP